MGLESMDLKAVKSDFCIEFDFICLAYLDSLGIKFEALFLVGEELLNILALIALELDHLSHLSIDDDGAIASYHIVRPDLRTRNRSSYRISF